MFPEDGLERLLRLVESLSTKIAAIDRSGLLDTSVLGEIVHPQNFNILKRIEEEDGSIIEEQEQFAELVSSEFLLQNLKDLLGQGIRQDLEILPDGIHSGLTRSGARGIFFYFTTREKKKRQHFWRYIDLSESISSGTIEENRYLITNLIQCAPEAPRITPLSGEVNIFALQEKVIASILHTAATQIALEDAPKRLDPIQQTVAAILKSYYNHPAVKLQEIQTALQRVNVPQPRVYLKTLKKACENYQKTGNIHELLASIISISEQPDVQAKEIIPKAAPLKREDLKLVCFEYLW
jgi:hypothetical protein